MGQIPRISVLSPSAHGFVAHIPSPSPWHKVVSFRPVPFALCTSPFALRSSASATAAHHHSPTMSTATTARLYWGPRQGVVSFNTNWSIINWDSVVIVTAASYVQQDPPTDDYRVTGPITVSSVAPHGPPFDPNNGVSYTINVNSSSPIPIVVDIIVLSNPPVAINYPPTTTEALTTSEIVHEPAK